MVKDGHIHRKGEYNGGLRICALDLYSISGFKFQSVEHCKSTFDLPSIPCEPGESR